MQLGNGDSSGASYSTPSAVSGGLRWSQISAGDSHTCGITQAGIGFCWGLGTDGKTGLASTSTVYVPYQIQPFSGTSDFTLASISAASTTTCAVTTAGLGYCWGNGGLYNRKGNNQVQNDVAWQPVLVSGGYTWASISAGWTHTCGITTAGVSYCWGGTDVSGALGNGGVSGSSTPVQVSTSTQGIATTFRQISANKADLDFTIAVLAVAPPPTPSPPPPPPSPLLPPSPLPPAQNLTSPPSPVAPE